MEQTSQMQAQQQEVSKLTQQVLRKQMIAGV